MTGRELGRPSMTPVFIPPRATMRLQLHRGFTFDDAARLAPYLARLGISHAYLSPILAARAGSPHGYDVTDPTRVNPELGGEDGFRRLAAALRAAGLGLIVDIVPNHMAVGPENAWWQDVLRHGPASSHAAAFDIDWHPDNPLLNGKVLLPVLGRQYGEALAAGEITLARGAAGWEAHYFDTAFPIAPADSAEIAAGGFTAYDPASEQGRARLHRLLERQHYRLAWWPTAGDEINWRRFFDINELVGVRVEIPAVFEAVHARLFALYAEGLIDGMRVDHVDGLADPGSYCRQLRARLAALAPGRHAWLVVEKILGAGEELPADWEIDGTTGYDFMDAVSLLEHDGTASAALGALWARLSGRTADFATESVAARREILARGFAAQLEACVSALHRVALLRPETRDASRPALRRALIELLAHFPIYRGYGGVGDEAAFAQALAGMRAGTVALRAGVPELIVDWLRAPGSAAARHAATCFYQLSAPVAAKAVEDTAFYRYGRLISRNDVGFRAAELGIEPADFHAACAHRAAQFPDAMLATATHDHKRGEDTRARLAVLSEIPEEWGAALDRWRVLNAPHRTAPAAPSVGDEVMLYQAIVGAWPPSLRPDDADGLRRLADRLAGWQEKALHEEKLATSWTAPDQGYEAAARGFLDAILTPGAAFAAEAAELVARVAPAGAVNGLAQALLKLTVPGVPDLYQGTEFWDLSLVDPDNRRPVDFPPRAAALAAGGTPGVLVAAWQDGRLKQSVIAAALRLRARVPALFARGDHVPLHVDGPAARHVVAFARVLESVVVLVAVPRLVLGLLQGDGSLRFRADAWTGTGLVLPDGLGGAFDDTFGGRRIALAGRVAVAQLLTDFPLGLLATRQAH